MSDVKWIKIVVDIFDDEKTLLIEAMPDSDSMIVIWFKILCLAGKQNNGGVLMLNNRMAYTDEMLATIFRRPISTVRLALSTFQSLGMIEIVSGAVTIPNWGKHQSLEGIQVRRDYMKGYMRDYREKQRQLASGVESCKLLRKSNVSVTEEKRELEREVDKEIEIADKPRKSRKVKIEFTPPTLDEVKAYIAEKGYSVNPQTFYDHFTEGEPKWVDANGKPVLNWKQKIVTWNSFNKDKTPAKQMVRYIHPDENGNPIEGWREA